MEEHEDKANKQQQCCDSPNAGCCGSHFVIGKEWKTAIFVLVILLATAIAAHSLIAGRNEDTELSKESTTLSSEKACSNVDACSSSSKKQEAVMENWINQVLENEVYGVTVLIAVFLLGVIGSLTSLFCTAQVVGAIVGYSGVRSNNDRR